MNRPIPVPLGRRLRRAVERFGPPVTTTIAAIAVVWLWQSHEPLGGLPGEVTSTSWELSSAADGRLVTSGTVPLQLLEAVQEGQVIARLDDGLLQAELGVLRAHIDVTRAEVTAAIASARFEREADRRGQAITEQRLSVDIQSLRLDVLDRRAEVETLRIALERDREQEDRLRDLVGRGAETPNALRLAELAVRQRETALREQEQALTEARRELRAAERRLAAIEAMPDDGVEDLIAPIRARIAVHEAELDVLARRREHLEVRAPAFGHISAIYRRPGEYVAAGEPIVRIASGDREHVIAWIPEAYPRRPEPGDTARIRPLPVHDRTWPTQVIAVGPRVEPLPEHQRRDPTIPEWGIPVRLALPDGLPARAGERLDVRF